MRNLTLSLILLLLVLNANAAVIVTTGTGTAVSVVDRIATFDAITLNGMNISAYTENQLSVTGAGTSFLGVSSFSSVDQGGYYYNNGGSTGWTAISTTDNSIMYGVEFLMADGISTGYADTRVVWETYANSILTGSGIYLSNRGAVVGWSDSSGFDELRVGANPDINYTALGQFQAIVVDDVKVALSPVPIPSAVWLFSSGLIGLIGLARRKANA